MSQPKKVRQGLRLQLSNQEKKLKPMMKTGAKVDLKVLRQSCLMLDSYYERLNEIDVRVLEQVESEAGNVDEEIALTAEYNEKLLELMTAAQVLLEDSKPPPPAVLAGAWVYKWHSACDHAAGSATR